MVECESGAITGLTVFEGVLIDTWWNVNNFLANAYVNPLLVLIDTWWNVNYGIGEMWLCISCFNRYMVECECTKQKIDPADCKSFNRYMVECE